MCVLYFLVIPKNIAGSPDIRASATAKATVAAFAASEGHAHPRYKQAED